MGTDADRSKPWFAGKLTTRTGWNYLHQPFIWQTMPLQWHQNGFQLGTTFADIFVLEKSFKFEKTRNAGMASSITKRPDFAVWNEPCCQDVLYWYFVFNSKKINIAQNRNILILSKCCLTQNGFSFDFSKLPTDWKVKFSLTSPNETLLAATWELWGPRSWELRQCRTVQRNWNNTRGD